MPDVTQTVAVAVAVVVAAILVLRLLVGIPPALRRARRPESRSILVVGVGGGGSNAVDRLAREALPGVGFVVINTDAQALRRSGARSKVRIGDGVTHGLGAGGDPEIGRAAAEADEERIVRAVAGADLVFVTACLGGGTGSGAAPIVAANAKQQGALTIGVVTKPFPFEGEHRRRVAETAGSELASTVDALVTIPNERVADVVDADASMLDAFRVVDDVVMRVVRGSLELLRSPGLVNLDFADLAAVMRDAGPALIGLGHGRGEGRAIQAAREALASPLLETTVDGARGILFNVSGPPDLRLREVQEAADEIRANVDPAANVIFGASFTGPADDSLRITLIATGLRERAVAEATADIATSRFPGSEPTPGAAGGFNRPTPRRTRTGRSRPEVAVGVAGSAEAPRGSTAYDDADLEVPSFLRRRSKNAS